MLNYIFKKKTETKIRFPNSLYFYFGLYVVYLIGILWIENNFSLWVLSVSCIFILLSYTYFKRKRLRDTYAWITVGGSLEKADIEKSFCPVYENFLSKKNKYEIVVEYNYKYNGHKFIGSIYALNQPCNYHYDYKKASEIVKKLKKDKDNLQLKVNPKNPNESVIVPGVQEEYAPSFIFIFLIYGSVFLLVPFMLM